MARRLGELYTELGKPDQALSYYRRALEFEPQNRKLFDAVDAILQETKQHRGRAELYRESLAKGLIPVLPTNDDDGIGEIKPVLPAGNV